MTETDSEKQLQSIYQQLDAADAQTANLTQSQSKIDAMQAALNTIQTTIKNMEKEYQSEFKILIIALASVCGLLFVLIVIILCYRKCKKNKGKRRTLAEIHELELHNI